MRSFDQIRDHLLDAGFNLTMQEPYIACVELSLESGRRQQSIFLSQLESEDGRNYLRVATAIAPIIHVEARRALAFNWHSRVGYLAVGDLDDVPYLQLCENRPYANLNGAEIERLVLEIGGLGDHLERRLSAEGDML